MTVKKTALIVGATGLVGNLCLEFLASSGLYSNVIAVSRKKFFPALLNVTNIVTDFDKLDSISDELKADHIYCALGTTIKKAGGKEQFRKVDYEYSLKIAEITKRNGAQKFMLVSSIGAAADSKIFYSKVKGELEDKVKELNFESCVILQPSFLLGERKELRLGEKIGKNIASIFSFAFVGELQQYKGIEAKDVAKAMIVFANKREGKIIYATHKAIVRAVDDYAKW